MRNSFSFQSSFLHRKIGLDCRNLDLKFNQRYPFDCWKFKLRLKIMKFRHILPEESNYSRLRCYMSSKLTNFNYKAQGYQNYTFRFRAQTCECTKDGLGIDEFSNQRLETAGLYCIILVLLFFSTLCKERTYELMNR